MVVVDQLETAVDVTHNYLICEIYFHRKKQTKPEHLGCWAPITIKPSGDVTMAINVVVEPRGSETE